MNLDTRQNTRSMRGHTKIPMPAHFGVDGLSEIAGRFGVIDDVEAPHLAVLYEPERGFSAVSWDPPCDYYPTKG